MSQYTQDKRLISIETPLAKDELLLTSIGGREYISDTFSFALTALSTNLAIKPEDLVGKPITVTIQNKIKRKFNGFVSSFSFGEIQANNLREYRLTMVPWLWFLGKTESRRIFQNKNTKTIVSAVFSKLGFNDFEFRAAGGKVREYCVQYGESDLHFVSRLLEEDGIAYFFKHEAKKHMLILVDRINAYEDCTETNLLYSQGTHPDSQINKWDHQYEFTQGVWTLNDYNFKESAKDLLTKPVLTKSKFTDIKKFEHYEYADMYDLASGEELAKIRMEAEEVAISTIHGGSDCSSFYAGGKFAVKQHEAKSEKGDFILTEVFHSGQDGSYFAGENKSSSYSNTFKCIPANVFYRPGRSHIRPVMRGPQSAVVTGPAGEEIYIDEFGRIKVQFIWDREGKKDEHSSCYLRVMQSWAGNQWGASFIPRIGHEVIVTFLDGDPDRPIVTGTVYNSTNKPVYPSKTQSGIKTHSTKGGSRDNFNELRFEDLKGSEQIFVHAEKNLDTEVENDETHTVDHDRTKTVKHDENSFINHDRNKKVDNNQTETIGKDKTITVGDNHSEKVGKNMTILIGQDLKESVKGRYLENVTEAYDLSAKTITMTAQEKITLQTGSAKIVMESNGNITITGATINVKGSGNVIIKGSKVLTN
jgi:type VI secretion system secreted protein VgrG